jgi:hypothetical protein
MWSRTNVTRMAVIAVLIVTLGVIGAALAQTKATAPKPQDKLALAEEHARELLLLIDTDKRGRSPNRSG